MSDEKSQYRAGDKPPEGVYVCMTCMMDPYTVIVPEQTKKLTKCPKCGGEDWYKV